MISWVTLFNVFNASDLELLSATQSLHGLVAYKYCQIKQTDTAFQAAELGCSCAKICFHLLLPWYFFFLAVTWLWLIYLLWSVSDAPCLCEIQIFTGIAATDTSKMMLTGTLELNLSCLWQGWFIFLSVHVMKNHQSGKPLHLGLLAPLLLKPKIAKLWKTSLILL